MSLVIFFYLNNFLNIVTKNTHGIIILDVKKI